MRGSKIVLSRVEVRRSILLLTAFVFITLAVSLLGACQANRGVLRHDGRIDAEFQKKVEDYPASMIDTIVINSKGGDYRAAISVANLMQEHEIELVVDGYCLSSCSSILLATSQKNSISQGSIVGFHNLIGIWYFLDEYLKRTQGLSLEGQKAFELSKEVKSIYDKSGIRFDIFVLLGIRQGIECLNFDLIEGQGRIVDASIQLQSELYIPNEGTFSQFNWNFSEKKFFQDAEFEELEEKIFLDTKVDTIKIEKESFEVDENILKSKMIFQEITYCAED